MTSTTNQTGTLKSALHTIYLILDYSNLRNFFFIMAILTLFFIGTLEFVLINCCLPNCVTLINPVKLSSTFVSYSRGPDANNEICSFPFPLVTLRVTCKSGRRLSSFLSFKERIPKLVRLRIYVLSIAEFYSNLYLYNNLDMLNER